MRYVALGEVALVVHLIFEIWVRWNPLSRNLVSLSMELTCIHRCTPKRPHWVSR